MKSIVRFTIVVAMTAAVVPAAFAQANDQGRLYVTVIGYGDVAVYNLDGSLVKRIPLVGKRPTNVAFGAKGEKRIYVTEQEIGQIEAYDVDADGMELYG